MGFFSLYFLKTPVLQNIAKAMKQFLQQDFSFSPLCIIKVLFNKSPHKLTVPSESDKGRLNMRTKSSKNNLTEILSLCLCIVI